MYGMYLDLERGDQLQNGADRKELSCSFLNYFGNSTVRTRSPISSRILVLRRRRVTVSLIHPPFRNQNIQKTENASLNLFLYGPVHVSVCLNMSHLSLFLLVMNESSSFVLNFLRTNPPTGVSCLSATYRSSVLIDIPSALAAWQT